MLRIVLERYGRKNVHFFHVIVRETKNNRIVEKLGYYNADAKTNEKSDKFTLNMDSVKYWISKGAQPSPLMKNIIQIKNQ